MYATYFLWLRYSNRYFFGREIYEGNKSSPLSTAYNPAVLPYISKTKVTDVEIIFCCLKLSLYSNYILSPLLSDSNLNTSVSNASWHLK